jgi:hypothetical protein
MARSYRRDDVEQHESDRYGRLYPAVNVKVYQSLSDGYRAFHESEPDHDPRFTLDWIEEHVSDESGDALFWMTCENEWEQVEQDAREILGASVTRAGRSGGWAVVTDLPDLDGWDAVQLARWRKFERYAKGIARGVMEQLVYSIYLNDFECWKEEASEQLGAEAFAPEQLAG